ncbi:hypothetical protein [Puia sp.]|jgi:hypothetical protein|uniref:hypothetical protein n=1 Tax=Puia sp. TaxID=2045100 RepID=UPI002F423EAC
MNYILIEGSSDAIDSAAALETISPMGKSVSPDDNTKFQLYAYSPDIAIPDIQALGLTVTILISDSDRTDHFASLEDDIDGTTIV